jgi:hypothetical protein
MIEFTYSENDLLIQRLINQKVEAAGRRNPVDNLGNLRHTWTKIDGFRTHSLAPGNALLPTAEAPSVILVHGSGLPVVI